MQTRALHASRPDISRIVAPSLLSSELLTQTSTRAPLRPLAELSAVSWNPRQATQDDIRPSTEQDFNDFFPSQRRLIIQHDNAIDGNMCLCIYTDGYRKDQVQLYHLKILDLKSRKFVITRHSRSSGKFVCQSSQKVEPPVLQRSLKSALDSLRAQKKPLLQRGNLKREDSGYLSDGEVVDDNSDENGRPRSSKEPTKSSTELSKSRAIRLEFLNYSRLDISLPSTSQKSKKRYNFEWWGHTYTWRYIVSQEAKQAYYSQEGSYHLINRDSDTEEARIVPVL